MRDARWTAARKRGKACVGCVDRTSCLGGIKGCLSPSRDSISFSSLPSTISFINLTQYNFQSTNNFFRTFAFKQPSTCLPGMRPTTPSFPNEPAPLIKTMSWLVGSRNIISSFLFCTNMLAKSSCSSCNCAGACDSCSCCSVSHIFSSSCLLSPATDLETAQDLASLDLLFFGRTGADMTGFFYYSTKSSIMAS